MMQVIIVHKYMVSIGTIYNILYDIRVHTRIVWKSVQSSRCRRRHFVSSRLCRRTTASPGCCDWIDRFRSLCPTGMRPPLLRSFTKYHIHCCSKRFTMFNIRLWHVYIIYISVTYLHLVFCARSHDDDCFADTINHTSKILYASLI